MINRGRSIAFAVAAILSFGSRNALAAPFSDDFINDSGLNPGWTVVSPNPASSVSLIPGTGLQMNASWQNGGSDLFSGSNYNAPVILQSINPSLNFTIETELNFSPQVNYQGAGILLATQLGNFTSSSQFDRIAERSYYPDGGGEIVENGNGPHVSYLGTVTYFKLTKDGDTYSTWYSANGSSWSLIGSEVNQASYDYIGLFTIMQPWNGNQINSQADYSFFDVTTSATPLPPTWTMMITGFAALALIACRRKRRLLIV
jgi:hypothetical protein